MRATIIAATIWLLCAMTAGAQEKEIRGTISSQIEAFKADDFVAAFEFATPTLRQMFRNPANFERMVTQGYPMVWRPAGVRYLELREVAGSLWQKVLITDAKGAVHVLDYKMEQTDAGWRIAGVQVLRPGGANA